MKTYLCYVFAMGAMVCSSSIFAQEAPENQKKQQPTPEQLIEQQVGRMERQLLLDEETAAKFAPIYKEYLEALAQCRPTTPDKDKGKPQPGKKEMNDNELDKMMQTRFETEKKRIEIQETYYAKFKSILTIRQVEKIFNNRSRQPQRPPQMNHPRQERFPNNP